MEDIDQRLQTIPPQRQQQFQRILKQEIATFSPDNENAKQVLIQYTKSQILRYLANEQNEKTTPRRHGSKGKKHRERGTQHIEVIKEKLYSNGLNHARALQELLSVSLLRVKKSEKGISYIGYCPLHNEKTPSLSSSPQKGVIKCFGCGYGGNVVHFFHKALKHTTFTQTLYVLEKYICTPQEAEERKERNREAMERYGRKTPQQQEKDEFVEHIREKYDGHHIPQKEFYAEFTKRKQEKRRREHEKNNEEDILPF